MPRITLACLVGLCAALHAVGGAHAQAYPTKVIKMIVPAGPGGPTDVLARLVADRMSAALGQPVVIDNRGGGGGAIGAKAVAVSRPRRLHAAVRQYRDARQYPRHLEERRL